VWPFPNADAVPADESAVGFLARSAVVRMESCTNWVLQRFRGGSRFRGEMPFGFSKKGFALLPRYSAQSAKSLVQSRNG
jgi:hypothetical protein